MKLLHKNWNKYHGLTLLLAAAACYALTFILWGFIGGSLDGPTTTGDYVVFSVFFLSIALFAIGVVAIILAHLDGKTPSASRAQHIFIAILVILSAYGLVLYIHAQARHRQADRCQQAVDQEANRSVATYNSQSSACDQLDKRTFIL